jgi:hypothetical protein
MRPLTVLCVATLTLGFGCSAAEPRADKKGPNSSAAQESAGKSEAQFKGKGVSFWARQLADKDLPTRIEAAKALKAIGPEAKAAVPHLKAALKERAWELLVTHGGRSANRTFTTVGTALAGTAPRQPTKDEIIAKLRRELEEKQRDIAALEKQQQEMVNDPALNALVTALLAIDRRELEAMVPREASPSTKTFNKVSEKIGSAPK